ncbi:MAG: hypothetical protein ACI4JN_00780 [Ruminococcus sp.]
MEKKMKKVFNFITIAMGITLSVILSTFNVIMSGHFTVPMLIISILISCTIAILLGLFVPVKKAVDKLTGKIQKKIPKIVLESLYMSIFYSFIITTCLVFAMTGMANKQLTKSIDGMKESAASITAEISQHEAEIENLEPESDEYKALNAHISEKRAAAAELEGKIAGMENGRPDPVKHLPLSLLWSTLISWAATIIFQPIIVKFAFKKYNVKMGMPRG